MDIVVAAYVTAEMVTLERIVGRLVQWTQKAVKRTRLRYAVYMKGDFLLWRLSKEACKVVGE